MADPLRRRRGDAEPPSAEVLAVLRDLQARTRRAPRGSGVMAEAFVCDYVRTPIGRFGGALASVRTDDLAAVPLKALMDRHPDLDWAAVDDVVLGCANQAGEDNRNVARMALLLAGLPQAIPGSTVNRLCGSGMDALLIAARAIKAGEAHLMIAGGIESMSRAPFVMPKAETAFSRHAEIHDTTIGWRFVNPLIKAQYGVDSMPETGENVAAEFQVTRADQDAFALRSQQRAAAAQASGRLAREITPVVIPQRRGEPVVVALDEHPPGRHDARQACEAADAVPRGRHDHRRQRLGRQRRCGGAARGFGSRLRPLRPRAARAGGRRRGGGRAAPDHGDRPGAGDAEAVRAPGVAARGDRRHRAERGLRQPGACHAPPARPAR